MKPSTREWVAKAEEDYLAALDLARRRKRPLWSGVCFHAQQCAEKYLKARMEEAGLAVPNADLDVLAKRELLLAFKAGDEVMSKWTTHEFMRFLVDAWRSE